MLCLKVTLSILSLWTLKLWNKKIQKAMIEIKSKFGKNAVLKGMDLQKNATAIERNRQIGGHKSGEN